MPLARAHAFMHPLRHDPPPYPRLRRWTRRAGLVLLAAYALYLLAGNAFLNLDPAQGLLNRKPDRFHIAWSGGRTLWPGQVVLRQVRMQGHARRMQWAVQAREVHGRIALWPLLRKQVRVPWVDAAGVTGTVARTGDERAPAAHRPGGWTLRMDRIASDSIEGGEVFGWQLAGRGTAVVGFSKQFRGGPTELFPSTAGFADTTVSRDGEEWLRALRLDAGFAMARHRSADYPGAAKLALIDARLDMDADTVALLAMLDAQGRYRFQAMPGEGRLEANLALADGALAPGGRLHAHMPLHGRDAAGAAQANALDLRLEVDHDLHLRAQVPEGDADDLALDADLRMPGTALPLADWRERLLHSDGAVRARLPVPSIGGVLALFTDADWLQLEGRGTVEADLRLAQGRLDAGSRLRVLEVDAHADVLGNRFSGRAHAEAVIEDSADGAPRSRLALAMQRFAVAPVGEPSRPYVAGDDLQVELESDARLEHMRDTLQARIRFADARVADLTAFNPYLPGDGLRFAGGSGRLSGDLRVDGEGQVGQGRLQVDARRARLAFAGLELHGDVAIDGRLRRGDLQDGLFELGGSRLRLRNVAFRERNGASRSGWWATIDLGSGRVEWKRPSSAGGQLRARLKDVGFLLAMFADRADYPAWITRVVDAGQVDANGRWLWRGDSLVLDRVHARNDRFQIDARLRLHGGDRRGDLHATWGVLGVGVELEGGSHKLHLRRARQWYDGRPHLLR